MTTLVTADLHLSDNPRDAYRLDWLARLPAVLEEHDATRLLILGDLTENKDRHSARLVNDIVDHVAALSELVDVVVLKGNHDYVNEEVPFYRFLDHIPRVRWINEPTDIKLRGLGRCLFVPHTGDHEYWSGERIRGPHDWYFCHQTFEGADVGHGHRMTGTPRDIFLRGARVISGDVHVPQKLGPITYVGAPYAVDFGDEYDPRVLLLDENEMTSLPCTGPQKRLVKVGGADPVAALTLGDDHPLGALLWKLVPGDVVKVRVDLPEGAIVSRTQVRAAVREWGDATGVIVHTVQIVASTPARTAAAKEEHGRRTDEELMQVYVAGRGAGGATLKAGLKLTEGV
jgi:hypothetical protein